MGSKNLNEKIMECISNPAKSRLLIEIMRRGEVTAKYLAEKCSDIPQTTLYRNLKRMTDDGLLKIVNETPIRGTVEKTYALTFDPSDPPSVLGENSGAIYMQMFFQYFLTFAKIFQEYCDTPGIDIKRDRSGLSLSHVYLTDEELETPFAKGMDMVHKQLLKMLEDADVKPIEALGGEFNPDFHNAVMHVEDDSVGENIVVEEFEKGYTYRDQVIRHSMVTVSYTHLTLPTILRV